MPKKKGAVFQLKFVWVIFITNDLNKIYQLSPSQYFFSQRFLGHFFEEKCCKLFVTFSVKNGHFSVKNVGSHFLEA